MECGGSAAAFAQCTSPPIYTLGEQPSPPPPRTTPSSRGGAHQRRIFPRSPLLATNTKTKPGAPSCAPQQGGRFCRSSTRDPPERKPLWSAAALPPLSRSALRRQSTHSANNPPSHHPALRRHPEQRTNEGSFLGLLFLPPTQKQNRVPHPASLSRVGGFVAALAPTTEPQIRTCLNQEVSLTQMLDDLSRRIVPRNSSNSIPRMSPISAKI